MAAQTIAHQDRFLETVRNNLKDTLAASVIYREMHTEIDVLVSGKMLRSRLIHAIGSTRDTPPQQCIEAATAVEMLHAASLLHDDVIDGGHLRRGAPALWVSRGSHVAILMGDMLLSLAFAKIAASQPHAVPVLADTLRMMCESEIAQASPSAPETMSWDDCIRIARGKTGSLFGFSAYCTACDDAHLAQALLHAGTQVGTAYQLADDLLDLQHDESVAGKTLGTDATTAKYTAATAWHSTGKSPQRLMQDHLDEAVSVLSPWNPVQQAIQTYIQSTLQPLIKVYTST